MRIPVLPLLFLGALAAGGAALAQSRADQQFSGAGQRNSIDCDGGSLHIQGASNVLTVTGACTRLEIEGASNEVDVDMAAGGRIAVNGASNRVRWTAPSGPRVQVSATGAGNRVARAGSGS